MMSRRGFLALLCFVLAGRTFAAEKVFKWVDDNGKVHFGDRPPDGARAEAVPIRSFTGAAEVSGDGEYGAKEVRILSTSWCKVCTRARDYLNKKGVYFVEYDIEKSEIGKAEYRRLQGRGVPIILVGNQRMNGFGAAQLDQMLKNVGYDIN